MRISALLWTLIALIVGAPIAVPAEDEAPPTPTKENPLAQNEMRDLTANEVDRYIAALQELKKLGLDASAQMEGDPSALKQRAAAAKYGEEMQKVLGRHDFDTQSFNDVHWNVLMAYLASELEQSNAEMQKAQAEQQQLLAEMKKQLPPEQYEQAAKTMQQLMPALNAVTNVPDGNRTLVAARRTKLDAIFENAKP